MTAIITEYLYYTMNAIFFGYVAFILIFFGILPSISDSWYEYKKRGIEKYNFLFTLFCWGFSLPAVMLGLELSQGSDFQFLMFLAASGIMFVGAAPDFKSKEKLDRPVHYVGALMGVIGITVFLFVVFTHYWYITATFVGLSLVLYALRRKVDEILWIEILSFASYSLIIGLTLEIF